MKKLITLLLALAMIFSLCACGQPAEKTPEAEQPSADVPAEADAPAQTDLPSYTIRLGDAAASDSESGRALAAFKAAVEEKSGGRITVELSLDGLLGSELEIYGQTQIGDLEMMAVGVGAETSFLPQFGILSLPYLFKDAAHKERAIMDPTVFDIIDSALIEAKDAHIVDVWEQGNRHLTANTEVLHPADINGMKIRVPDNSTFLLAWKALGANVVTMGMGELYTALQQHTCDGQENPLGVIKSQSLYEAQDYIMLTGHVPNMRYILVNNTWWNSLPAEDQALITECVKEAGVQNDDEIHSNEQELISFFEGEGLTIVEVDTAEWVEAMNLEELVPSVSAEMGWDDAFNEAVLAVD